MHVGSTVSQSLHRIQLFQFEAASIPWIAEASFSNGFLSRDRCLVFFFSHLYFYFYFCGVVFYISIGRLFDQQEYSQVLQPFQA